MKSKDSKEIEKLYRQFSPKLYAMCWRDVGYNPEFKDLIEDCVQETFLTLTGRLETLYDHPSIEGWLVVTCRHRLLREISKRKIIRNHCIIRELDDIPNPSQSDIEQWIDDDAVLGNKERILALLNDKQKVVFLDYVDGCHTVREMASETGMSESAIRAVMTRIRKKIKKSGILFHKKDT